MTTLAEIEAAKARDDWDEAFLLKEEWHIDRGMTKPFAAREVYMRYIERLEARLAIAVPALQSIATPALGGKTQQYTAQHALKALAEHEREEAR